MGDEGDALASWSVRTVSMYGLLTKCQVKMAGYWPSSFFACLWTETKSRVKSYIGSGCLCCY